MISIGTLYSKVKPQCRNEQLLRYFFEVSAKVNNIV